MTITLTGLARRDAAWEMLSSRPEYTLPRRHPSSQGILDGMVTDEAWARLARHTLEDELARAAQLEAT